MSKGKKIAAGVAGWTAAVVLLGTVGGMERGTLPLGGGFLLALAALAVMVAAGYAAGLVTGTRRHAERRRCR